MSGVIKADNVSIRYITGDFKDIGLKEYIVKRFTGNYNVTEFWADRNISFELEKGDMMGIIGTNGAGKSTLLKAISGIMIPTEGVMTTKGSIAALLELASGFDSELTVRENTYLRGAMLGYTREFMDKMYDQIIEFAELSDFQERPFKQLSSGMKSRLAFSIACLVNPDIIILDEVLSVGDGSFKAKSANKMREILDSGVTGILVSHSLSQVRDLCNKILWLDHGKQIAFTDETELYLDAYEEFLLTKQLPQSRDDIEELAQAFKIRKSKEQKRKERTEVQKLQAILEAGNSDAAVQAAINILKKSKPEILSKSKKPENKIILSDLLTRISGKDRYDTSLKIADQLKKHFNIEKFNAVVLTDGEIFSNALSGGYIAINNNAPLLFFDPNNIDETVDYLADNLAVTGKIYIIGNIGGVADSITKKINNADTISVVGENIYEINLNSLKLGKKSIDRILICTGENFADSISAIATGLPIMLVQDALSDTQINFIKQQKIRDFTIIGGTIAVNEIIESDLQQFGTVERIKGRTRYDTSAVIAGKFFGNADSIVVASGMTLTDGFYAGVYSAHLGVPMLLANKNNTDPAAAYVQRNKINTGIVIGNETVVTNTTANIVFSINQKEE